MSEIVNRMEVDGEGVFWMLSASGLTMYDPMNATFRHLDVDGGTASRPTPFLVVDDELHAADKNQIDSGCPDDDIGLEFLA